MKILNFAGSPKMEQNLSCFVLLREVYNIATLEYTITSITRIYKFRTTYESLNNLESGDIPVVNVYDISTWKKLGFKKLSKKTASTMAVSLDGKYIAL